MPGPPESMKQLRRRNGSKHDKTGCLTCRFRHKKCVLNTFPVCGECSRLNLECLRAPARRVFPVASHTMADISSQWRVLSIYGDVENSKRRSAMNFYITTLSQLLTVTEQDNCFLSAFLPMALESPALASALVAWSAGHLASRDNYYHSTALEARSNALRSLAMSLSTHDVTAGEINAATSLVLMTSEVCLGCHTEWYGHLVGVKHVIMSTRSQTSTGDSQVQGTDALKQSFEGKWILRNFAYHDILGSVTLGKSPLMESSYLQDITNVVDTYLGVASGILVFLSDISCLEQGCLIQDYMSQNESEEGLPNSFNSIERRVKDWICPPGTTPALASLAYAYRSSALIYLYRRTLRGLKVHISLPMTWRQCHISSLYWKIQAEVSSVLQHVAKIPSSGIVESALLFPLFMAGGEATDHAHMDVIWKRLEEMLGKRRFENIQQAMEVLKEVWEQRKAHQSRPDDCDVDWQDFADRREGGLLLT